MCSSETSIPPVWFYSSNSLRVTHPDAVVIGLLCVDVARTFGVPQGSGSLCLHVLLYKQVLWEQKGRCETAQKQQWMRGMGSQKTILSVGVQAISRLFHKLLTPKLFWVTHNKNNGDKWGRLRERWTLVRERERVCVSHPKHHQQHIDKSHEHKCPFLGLIVFGMWQRWQQTQAHTVLCQC